MKAVDLPKIDERGMESLSPHVASHPNCESIDLKAKIKQEALESYCRQHNLDIESILRERKALIFALLACLFHFH